jgi:uncharacterized protein DUF6262
MPGDSNRLAEHARHRHEQTLQRAQAALAKLANNGGTPTVAGLAREAGVSRSWIYTQPELRDLLEQLQHTKTPIGATGQGGNSRASEESLRRRLALAHQRIAQLRNDNHELRQMLARAHGDLRAAKAHQTG